VTIIDRLRAALAAYDADMVRFGRVHSRGDELAELVRELLIEVDGEARPAGRVNR
jgi:hypothetical protein